MALLLILVVIVFFVLLIGYTPKSTIFTGEGEGEGDCYDCPDTPTPNDYD